MKLTDDEIIAALEAEESRCGDSTGALEQERSDALARYRGAPLGNEVEGRSQVVDRSIMDTIEWIMPSLVRVYLGGDEIGKFEPRGPEDEKQAQQETDVCGWYLEARNDFFSVVNATLRDALLLKNGYMVGSWRKKTDEQVEIYEGKTDDEIALLLQDPEIEVVEHSEFPGPFGTLHTVKVVQKTADEFVAVDSVPPDEIIVNRTHRHTSLADAQFVEWVRRDVTVGQLRAEGFKIEDDEGGDDRYSLENASRDRFFDQDFTEEETEPSQRRVTFRDAYYRIDLRGAGTPQLWRIARVDGSRRIALKEEADIIPIAAFSPLIYPHSHIGTSIYDLIADIGLIKTTLQRQALDGVYLQHSGRMAVDVNRVNLDDLLVARPGGIVRVDGSLGDALMPITTPDTSGSVLGMLEFIEAQKEGRTGVTRYSAGLDANSLNKTATGVQAIQNAANQRIELIARTLAGGFKDLFCIVHALASKHSTQALVVKLKNNWLPVNPREWKKRSDFSVSVGLGTGTPEQQLQKLVGLSPVFQQGMGMGLAGPNEAYEFGKEIWKAAGYKNPDRFIKAPKVDPQTGEPQSPPPQKDPLVQAEEVKAQAGLQAKQMEMQGKQGEMQAKAQFEAQKLQQEAAFKEKELSMTAELERFKAQLKAETEITIAQMREQLCHERELAVGMKQAELAGRPPVQIGDEMANEHLKTASDHLKGQSEAISQSLGMLAEAIQAQAEALSRPKMIVRGKDGRAVGVQ